MRTMRGFWPALIGVLCWAMAAAALASPAYTIKLAHHSLDTFPSDPPVVNAYVFKNAVEFLSEGDIEVKIYPNRLLGNAREVVESTQLGIIQACLTFTSVFTLYSKEVALLQIPFIFPNEEVAIRVLRGPFGQDLAENIRKQTGIRVLNWSEGCGFRQFFSTRPIRSTDDMRGLKIRVPENEGLFRMFKTLGADPVIIPWSELYIALQNGEASICETEIQSGLIIQLDDIMKYLTISRHAYNVEPLLINDAWFRKLPGRYQRIILKAADQADRAATGHSRTGELIALQAFKKTGMNVSYMTPDQRETFRQQAQPTYLSWIEKEVGRKWLDRFITAVDLETRKWDAEITARIAGH